MARAASKKLAAQNATMVRILTYGFLLSNLVHLLVVFGPFRSRTAGLGWPFVKYAVTESIAGALGITLLGMARQGDDLQQPGLTAYMFDVVYVTWFVHIGTALIWSKLWYLYLVIPGYAVFLGYTKLVVPFVLGGRDPIAGRVGAVIGSSKDRTASSSTADQATDGGQQAGQSKRQAKLQKRMERGDPRVQARQQN